MGFVKIEDVDLLVINDVKPLTYIKWNNAEKKMEHSGVPAPGYRADYSVVLDSGDTLALTEARLGKLLVAAYQDGKADIRGNKFKVTHNVKIQKFDDGEKEVDYPEFEMVKGEQSSSGEDFPL